MGATPAATVSSQVAVSLKRRGEESPYLRVEKGIYTMRSKITGKLVAAPRSTAYTPRKRKNVTEPALVGPDTIEADDTEPQYDIVTSFSMFWRREAVD